MVITYKGFRLWRVGRRIAVAPGNDGAFGSFFNWDCALKFVDRAVKGDARAGLGT